MEQSVHTPEVYDYRKYDRIWQRVAPGLEPYPGLCAEAAAANGEGGTGLQEVQGSAVPGLRRTENLPGAIPDPCCMGSAAAEMLEVLTGFAEEELADRRQMLALARQAPAWARQRLRELAAEEGAHARRLMAVYYLITGECYRPNCSCDPVCMGRWCPALRERYHAAACNGLNYARAAEGTTDPCLTALLNELSADEYRHADILLQLLERALQC